MKRKVKTIDPKIKKELENGTYHMKYRDFDIDIISKIFDLGTTKIPVPGLSASIYHDEGEDGQGNKIISDGQIYSLIGCKVEDYLQIIERVKIIIDELYYFDTATTTKKESAIIISMSNLPN